ncbi:MAG: nuclear transport factor 2 family protein [Gammaproteobacteria bacterium]|nr:nuclear transport factor 2 family protein [Gammaproteobacteria bacterium]
MNRSHFIRMLGIACVLSIGTGCNQSPNNTDVDARVAELEQKLDTAVARIGLLEDRNAIVRLQRVYGYYLDKAKFDELLALFTDDVSLEYSQRGVYIGKARAEQLMKAMPGGETGLQDGMLQNHIQIGGVVDVNEDGTTALGRWRALIMMGSADGWAAWQEGIYENEYRKEGGVWKISKVHFYLTLNADYEGGWGKSPRGLPGVDANFPPDAPPSEVYGAYPSVYLPPYHYPNPVTGR